MRNRLLIRMLRLMRLLDTRRGRSVRDLASELGVTYRTVYRDLAALQEAQLPITEEREWRHVRYRLLQR